MLFEKVEKSRIITFYFKTSTVDVGVCMAMVTCTKWLPAQGNSPSITSQNSTVKW